MAIAAVLPAMNGEKTLHPFFRKPNDPCESTTASEGDDTDRGSGVDGVRDAPSKPGKKRKSKETSIGDGKTQKTLDRIINPTTTTSRKFDGREIPNSCSSDIVYSPARKKRRTSPVEPLDEQQENDGPTTITHDTPSTPHRPSSPQVIIPASSPLPASVPGPIPDVEHAPKKMLRLTASGKFSSPPSKKQNDAEPKSEEPSSDPPRRRGRPRKSKEAAKPEAQHCVVVIRYANENEKGDQIDRILRGEERVQKETKTSPKKLRAPRKQGPAKPTHPFFAGKQKEQHSEQQCAPKHESPWKVTASTPGKLRRQALGSEHTGPSAQPPTYDTWTSSLLKDRMMMKHPGAMEPAWPSKEQAHVRSLANDELRLSSPGTHSRRRKRKSARKDLSVDESVLGHFTTQLTLEDEGELRDDGFREPHPSLRLPRKLLISGQEVWEAACKELSTAMIDDNVDELSCSPPSQRPLHPAIENLRKRMPKSLSAFDELRGENHSWTQKYAPTIAAEVLQNSREMDILKTWLTSLTITSVDNALKSESRHSPKPENKPTKKRRRKNKDMDDFLVDSDEEVHDMDELTDPEDEPTNAHNNAKSMIQAAKDGTKLSNAVLLAGPHGCGKTAAAYAVARELGYKVFEISSSERRSGRDVLEKVGDMAENHLVKHHGTGIESGDTSAAEEPSRNEEAFQRDLASGRQGKMDSFFRPKANAKKTSPKKAQPKPKLKANELLKQAVKKQPKDQQQSLILLEEVDILFKEDKDFWTTVVKLVTTSKRPFVMTCNDEDLVPMQMFAFHAILRFSPPPIDLATDYLLAIAASEGHLITRNAIASLYRSNDHDLRASISELNFWCQMGIGDPKLGLSWIYPRFPPATDVDDYGRRIRVVSEGSYQAGMGHTPDSRLSEYDQALWAMGAFGPDLWTSTTSGNSISSPRTTPTLKHHENFAASLSAIDVYSSFLNIPQLDTLQPPMPNMARSQYIDGMRLLQTDEIVNYDNMLQELAVVSSLAAHRNAGMPVPARDTHSSGMLPRRDFACFDAIAVPSEGVLSSNPGLSQSVFDGSLRPIALDVAPYVRSILQNEAALSEQHSRLNNILDDGHRTTKRMRTTRAARSALHGSQRSLTRREKWFTKNLDVEAVLATGGENWPKTTVDLDELGSRDGTETPSPSAESS